MTIIENGNKTYIKFQYLVLNDVFRPKNSNDIYIRIASHEGLNAWGLTNEDLTFFHSKDEVELLNAELHINS